MSAWTFNFGFTLWYKVYIDRASSLEMHLGPIDFSVYNGSTAHVVTRDIAAA